MEEPKTFYRPIKTNYLEREQNNRTLGEGGEKLVLDYERWRLIKTGKKSLADKVDKNSNNFFFYRVFNFDTTPQFFIKQGKYEDFCMLQPVTFKGSFLI